MYQNRYERDSSRDRSRDRDRKYHNKSPSQDSNEYRKHRHSTRDQKENRQIKFKRVKFQENLDIKVFRKEDEPNAKGLTQEDILKIKSEFEKQIAKSYDFNWQHYKHRDAMLQSNSMKEQKQREKLLNEKLMNVKQGMVFVNPLRIRNAESIIEIGVDSLQKEAHTARIQHVLGCYYTHQSQIPNQPQFQILNTNNTSECKIIKFDNETFNNDLALGNNTKKNQDNQKPIKGILKTNTPQPSPVENIEPRTINPNLIYLLKDIKLNPTNYTKEKTQQLLKPYKESGELEYLTKNKDVLEKMLKSTSTPPPSAPSFAKPTFTPSSSAGRQSHDRPPSYSNQPPQMNQPPHMGGYGHTFVPKADKYRTVPCKYYHGPQGCNKIDNCTYIHDERYPGVPVPITQPPINQGSQGMPKMPMNYMQPAGYNPYPNTNMPNMPNMSSMGNPPSNMGHPGYMMGGNMGYQGGSNYYNNPPPNAGGGYSGGYAPNPYMRGQYNTGGYNNPVYPPYYNNPNNPNNPPKQ